MFRVTRILSSVAAAGLLPLALGAPAPQMSYGENTGAVGGVTPPIPTVISTSGSLYGPPDLLGEVGLPSIGILSPC